MMTRQFDERGYLIPYELLDADLETIERDLVDQQPTDRRTDLFRSLTLGGSLETYRVDGHLIPVYDPTDERYANTIARIAYFREWFGQDRDGNPKGVLRLTHAR